MEAPLLPQRFTLLGGPFHRLGCRLGLVRDRSNTVRFGIAIAASLWLTGLLLAVIEGQAGRLLSVECLSAHTRLLVAIPLAFLCEAWFDPRATDFLVSLVRTRVIDESSERVLKAEIERLERWRDSWIPELGLLIVIVLVTLFGPRAYLAASFSTHELSRSVVPWVGHWYWIVCMPVFRFIVLRWVLHLALWTHLLWRVSRMRLRMTPTHADLMGGLGSLEVAQVHLTPLVFAISAVQSATLAEEVYFGRTGFEAVYIAAASILFLQTVLFLSPLLLFSKQMWNCKVTGLADYSAYSSRYSREFEKKWIRDGSDSAQDLLGTPDVQSLADLSTGQDNVTSMRVVPVSLRGVRAILLAAVLPLLPLTLLKLTPSELFQDFFGRIIGL